MRRNHRWTLKEVSFNFLTIIYQLLWISGILKTGSLHSKVLDVVSLSTSLTICPTLWNRYHSGDILKRSAPEGITSDLRTILRYQIRTFLNFVKSLVHHSLVSYTILGVGYQIFHVFPFQYCSICKVNNLENSKSYNTSTSQSMWLGKLESGESSFPLFYICQLLTSDIG